MEYWLRNQLNLLIKIPILMVAHIIQVQMDASMKMLQILRPQVVHIIDATSSHGVKPQEMHLIMMFGIQVPHQVTKQLVQQLLLKEV